MKNQKLSICIAELVQAKEDLVTSKYQKTHFQVIVRNISQHDVSIWKEWCSWGYFNLSFVLTDEYENVRIIKKRPREWDKNFPDFLILKADDVFAMNVIFDSETWENIPIQATDKFATTVDMIAVYEIDKTPESKKHGVWTGKIVSEKESIKYHL